VPWPGGSFALVEIGDDPLVAGEWECRRIGSMSVAEVGFGFCSHRIFLGARERGCYLILRCRDACPGWVGKTGGGLRKGLFGL